MYSVCVEFRVVPGQREAFLLLIQHHASTSLREEPGCVQFDVIKCSEEQDVFMLYETYVDEDAFIAHASTDRFAAIGEQMAPMISHRAIRKGERVFPSMF